MQSTTRVQACDKQRKSARPQACARRRPRWTPRRGQAWDGAHHPREHVARRGGLGGRGVGALESQGRGGARVDQQQQQGREGRDQHTRPAPGVGTPAKPGGDRAIHYRHSV